MKVKKRSRKRFGLLCFAMLAEMALMRGTANASENDYEARIGDVCYGSLETAFEDVGPGETIFVVKDCSVSGTLTVNSEGIVLRSEDTDNPAIVRRDRDFAGKDYYMEGTGNILVAVESGSLTMQDIILDGGAVLDGDFQNTGQTWESPLVYVKGAYRIENGTVLQNNYNTDGNEDNSIARFSGAVQVMEGGVFEMCGGTIRNCYTNGSGGGVHARSGSDVSIVSGNIWNCYGMTGGAMAFFGPAKVSGMTLSGNCAKTGGAVEIHHEVRMSECIVENNRALLRGGAVGISGDYPVTVEKCSITGNSAAEGSAVSISDAGGNSCPVFKDCTITGNRVSGSNYGAIHYMGRAGMALDGDIVMGDNTATDGTGCDIYYMYGDAAPVLLGGDFANTSVLVLGGSSEIVSGKLLVDASSFGKAADTEHFIWSTDRHFTEAQGGDIYLTDAPEKYFLFYDANNGEPDFYESPERYSSGDAVSVAGWLNIFSEEQVKKGYTFVGWNTEADGTGIDYREGEEIYLAGNLWLYAKWIEDDGNEGDKPEGGGTGRPGETEPEKPGEGGNGEPGEAEPEKPEAGGPGEAGPDRPGEGGSSGSGETGPEKPGEGGSAEPGEAEPDKPEEGEPYKPGGEGTGQPGEAGPDRPGEGGSAEPGEAEPDKPEEGEPYKPGGEGNAKPGETEPDKPEGGWSGKSGKDGAGQTEESGFDKPEGNKRQESGRSGNKAGNKEEGENISPEPVVQTGRLPLSTLCLVLRMSEIYGFVLIVSPYVLYYIKKKRG